MIHIAVLTTDIRDVSGWTIALDNHNDIEYNIIDITVKDWIDCCLSREYDLFLLRSPGTTNLIKQIFDERVQVLSQDLNKTIYPPLTEIRLHENKKYLSLWLEAHGVPCPRTSVILSKKEASVFLKQTSYPIVAKLNIGSSGKGVQFLETATQGASYIRKAFYKGVKPKIGPNLRTATLLLKIRNAMRTKGLVQKRMSYYKAVLNEPQKYVIFQEYVKHDFEWRAVVIGDSYFAHKKVVSGNMASGSLQKNYSNPPLELLDFVRDICIRHELISTSFDIFQTDRGFLVNEIQTLFGQSDPYQMMVNGVVGRYRFVDDIWVFEPGDWALNQCYNLRLEHAIQLLKASDK